MGICYNLNPEGNKLNPNSFLENKNKNNWVQNFCGYNSSNKINDIFTDSIFTYTGRESLTNIEKELLSISLVFEINKVRSNPKNYIKIIEKYKGKILTTKNNDLLVKVSHSNGIILKNGNDSFDNCINFLNNSKPIHLLRNEPLLQIPFPYHEMNKSTDTEYIKFILRQKINELKDLNCNNIQLKKFHYDINSECAEASCVMQLVDDAQNDLIRRKNILSDDVNSINVNCTLLSKGIVIFYVAFGSQ